jgi:hypothetical protein
MKVASPERLLPRNQSMVTNKRSSEHESQQSDRGHLFYEIVAIVAIGVATMLALVLLQLITAGP